MVETRHTGAGVDADDPPVLWEFEASIERIVPGGFGLAHDASRAVFVEGAAPGDRLRIGVERVRGGIGFGRSVEILEPSPVRVAPPYPALVKCGGCDVQHLSYPGQLDAKVGIVADCLRRIARVEAPGGVPITPSPREWGYRTRAEWRIDPEDGALGYVAQGSHRVCDLPHDPIVVPELDAVLDGLRARRHWGELPQATAFRAAAGDEGVSLSPSLAGEAPDAVVRRVGGESYEHDADSFFQANPGVLGPLVEEVLRYAPTDPAGRSDRTAIDLYAGVGLFTLPLARRFGRVVGVEAHAHAAAFATRNTAAAGLRNVRIEAMPVGRWLADGWRSFGRPPLLVLDPPRAGVGVREVKGLLRLRPDRIAYVACDPATLARDLAGMVAGGYRLEGVAAFDMFPQTHHVEVVAHLARD